MKNSRTVSVLAIIALLFSGCGTAVSDNGSSGGGFKVLSLDFKVPICDQVPKSVIEKAAGKAVTEVKPKTGNITNTCDYVIDKNNTITLRLNKLSYENQKAGQSGMEGVAIETDSSIKAEHFIVDPPTEIVMASVLIKAGENTILTAEKGMSPDITKKQIIAVAAGAVNHLK
ncbi:MAG: hypothetical protein ACOYUZ_01840 [Patescibacteria group bacterium]